MITVSTAGLDVLSARLTALSPTLAARLTQEIGRVGGVLRDRVERNLSGAVLRQRSGRLAASIAVEVERVGIGARLSVSSDTPYAAIHEYGGIIPGRTILPGSARALSFPWRRQRRFFKRVSLPAVTMPERSFLRAALSEAEADIRSAIAAAAAEVIQG